MNRKYIFFDIDGTLAVHIPTEHRSYMPDSTRQTLKQLKANGHFVSIATGRAHWMTSDLLALTGIDNLVTDGGNGVVLGGELVELLPLDHDKSLTICRSIINDGLGMGVLLGNNNKLYCRDDRFARENPGFANFIDYVIDEHLEFTGDLNIYKIFISLKEGQEHLYPVLKELPYMRYHPGSIMIEPADKFAGIRRVMSHLNAPIEEVVVFGDGWNDMEMFKQAPLSIAMGNAIDELKAIADFTTKAADENGIEYACRHFGWT